MGVLLNLISYCFSTDSVSDFLMFSLRSSHCRGLARYSSWLCGWNMAFFITPKAFFLPKITVIPSPRPRRLTTEECWDANAHLPTPIHQTFCKKRWNYVLTCTHHETEGEGETMYSLWNYVLTMKLVYEVGWFISLLQSLPSPILPRSLSAKISTEIL